MGKEPGSEVAVDVVVEAPAGVAVDARVHGAVEDAPGRLVLAVDGNSLVHRSYHSNARTATRSLSGRPNWAVRGLLSQLVHAVDRVEPDLVVVGFDDPRTSRRRERWPAYKAHRADKHDALVEQIDYAVEVLRALGVAVVVPPGLEADDVLASVARLAPTVGAETVVVTSDRDMFCLIDEHTRLLRIIDGGVESSPMLTPQRLELMLGVRPEQYHDLAALRGDPSDNLPGVPGIGPKTAAKLLAALGSAEAAFADLDRGGERVLAAVGTRVARALARPESRTAWELNREIMRMHADVPLDLSGAVGALPVAADVVRAVFDEHRLEATRQVAVRVLARVEDEAAPRRPWAEPSWAPAWDRPIGRAHRFPPLRRARPVAGDQLSLFEAPRHPAAWSPGTPATTGDS